MMEIGAQLFTLREHCKTLDDFALTLRRVADMGYRNVQVSGTCAFDAAWLKEQLDLNGLRCVVTHTPAPRLTGETEAVCREHHVFGCEHIGLGWYAFDKEKDGQDYDCFLRTYRPVAETIRAGGRQFVYHNHDQEFKKVEGKLILEKLAEDFEPSLLGFVPDTFWIQAGGGDPAAWIERLSGRVTCIHLKDYAYGRTFAPIGEGNLNWPRIFAAAEKAGTRYMLVEQDNCYGEDPFECLKRSYDYLRSEGF